MHKKLSFTNGRGDTLVGILHDPIGNQTTKPPVMLLCHGFGSDKDRITYLTLETLLAERGIAVFRFDFYGHGESEGDISDITISEGIDDAIHAYDLLLEQGYTKIGLFGSSFGGCVALHIAAKLNEKLEILVCKAPVSDYQQKYDTQMGAEGIAERKARGRRPYVGRTGETFQINYSMYEDELKYCDYKVYTHISIPTLIVHGGHDMGVPVEQSYKTAKLIPDCTLKVIDTADHGFTGVGEAEQAYAYFLEFITKHLVE